jgi:hypothetical protein
MKQPDPATVSGPWRGHPERGRAGAAAGSRGVPSPDGDAPTQFDRLNPAAIHPDGRRSPGPGRVRAAPPLLGDPTGIRYRLRVGIRLVLRDLDRTEGLVAAGDEVGLGARLLGCRGHTHSYPLVNRPFTATSRAGGSRCPHRRLTARASVVVADPGMPRPGRGYGRVPTNVRGGRCPLCRSSSRTTPPGRRREAARALWAGEQPGGRQPRVRRRPRRTHGGR